MSKRDRQLAGVNLLELAPVRIASWSVVEGRVVVERPKPARRGPWGWLEKLSWLTGVPRLRLDDTGGFVWRRLDGSTPVGELCAAMRREMGEACEPAEERVGVFLRMLRKEGLIAYPGFDDEAIARWRQTHDP
jgi:hypothetical protein